MAIPKMLMSWGFLIYQEKNSSEEKMPFGGGWGVGINLFSDNYLIEFK